MPERHTLLVVDDEAEVVRSIQDLLRRDYRVLGATRAEEGLRLLGTEEVHVVMSDQRMPEMTGVEFLHRVRDEHPDAVRLLFTGYADIQAVMDAINEGHVYRYINKPWNPDDLQAVIKGAVERYELVSERKHLLEELQKKNTELERANSLKVAFIEVASHELRTPVTILAGMAQFLYETRELPRAAQECVDSIHNSSQRLQEMTEQIILMLQAGQFQHQVQLQYTNLSSVVTTAIDDIRPFIEKRRQHLIEDFPQWPEDLGTMAIDAPKMRDVLNHLLLNAIKFTPDEGTITVWARRTEGVGAEIRVSDTGTGIAPDLLPHIFEPFFAGFDIAHHASGRYEYKSKGMGLGLSVVKSFVEMHGGTITVDTEVEKGTTFTITLPENFVPAKTDEEEDDWRTHFGSGELDTGGW
jgi:signal transduction histidine kinase